MTEPTDFQTQYGITEEKAAELQEEGILCTDIIGRVLANRSLTVVFGSLTAFIGEICTDISIPARTFIAVELERLALQIRNLPTDNQPEQTQSVGNTLN